LEETTRDSHIAAPELSGASFCVNFQPLSWAFRHPHNFSTTTGINKAWQETSARKGVLAMRRRIMALLVALAVSAFAAGAQAMDMPAVTEAPQGMDLQATLGPQGMDMHAATPVDNLTPAANPKYPVGAQVVIETDHMPGMQGAKGVISGAYDTTLYAVDYTASDGTRIENHRWVVAEEIVNDAGKSWQVGDAVTLAGKGHMESMGGAGMQAVIRQVAPGPAYMVDYDPVGGGARVTNHQWMAEFELGADTAS
jgi:hypothetical protein